MAQFTLSTAPIRRPQSLFELVTDLGGEIIGSIGATTSLKNTIDEAISGSLAINWPSARLLLSPTEGLQSILCSGQITV